MWNIKNNTAQGGQVVLPPFFALAKKEKERKKERKREKKEKKAPEVPNNPVKFEKNPING